jgi:hypothetical protein
MGVDICQYGNHKMNFYVRNIEKTAIKIKDKLDNFNFTNGEYLKAMVLHWEKSGDLSNSPFKDETLEKIKRINETKNWKWNYKIRTEGDYIDVVFIGYLDFELEFSNDKIYFWDPPYRFFSWFHGGEIVRDEWRKYMYQTVHLFGGDRVIYLPDNMIDSSKYLDDYDGIDSPFDEIEQDLINEYGEIKIKLSEFTDEDYVYYYIDTFDDLILENSMPLNDFTKYLGGDGD